MAWTISGGIGALGDSDTDALLKRLDSLRESRGPSVTYRDVILSEVVRPRRQSAPAATLAEIRDLLRPTE